MPHPLPTLCITVEKKDAMRVARAVLHTRVEWVDPVRVLNRLKKKKKVGWGWKEALDLYSLLVLIFSCNGLILLSVIACNYTGHYCFKTNHPIPRIQWDITITRIKQISILLFIYLSTDAL